MSEFYLVPTLLLINELMIGCAPPLPARGKSEK